MYAIVGLGNVGEEYKDTRHNAGFMVIDELSRRWNITLKRVKFLSFFGKGEIKRNSNKEDVVLAKPLTYMNLSGNAVKPLIDSLVIPTSHLIIIHDDLDIPVGKFRIRVGGGDGGHKGIISILSLIESDFIRIKVGIGQPVSKSGVIDFVLSRFDKEEKLVIKHTVKGAADAIELIIFEGIEKAQTIYNR